MKQLILIWTLVTSAAIATAQLPEDVLRYSYFPQSGTARNTAIGGAMGSLGGDINALYVNPAGLGMFKTREFVLSPGVALNRNKSKYRGTDTSNNNTAFGLGTSGFVFGYNTPGSKWTNQAISIGVTQSANFNNRYSYSGTNNVSSYAEMFAEQFSQSGQSIDDALNNQSFAYGTAPALYTYLVDTFRNNSGGYNIKALPEFLLENNIALKQSRTVATTGGIYEVALGYATNMDDKFYIGGTLGVPIINYERNTTFRESDPTSNPNNNFDYFEINNRLTTKGFGINGKVGLIFKPQDYLRLGLAIHTPTFYSLTDRESADLTSATENYTSQRVRTASSTLFTDGLEGITKYAVNTPWRIIMSGSYVIREINDTRKQRGFITADVEYIGYGGTNFRADGEYVTSEDQQYYQDLKTVVNQYYKGTFNFKLGGELKFNTIMFRLGGAYYSNPYRIQEFNSNIKQMSGGIGYRNYGMFLDLTYVQNWVTDINQPYVLSGKTNTFATLANNRGNVVLTLGFKI